MSKEKKIPKGARLLGKKEVLNRIPWSHSTLYRKMKEEDEAGRFPKQVRVSANRCGWWEHEVDEYLEKIAEAAA